MAFELGVILAFVALLCWGVGDFLLQKTVRKVGNWETLFLITTFTLIILTPFIWRDVLSFHSVLNSDFLILLGVSFVFLIASLINYEALKEGKIAVVEPILTLEVPVSAFLALVILSESINLTQVIMIVALLSGIMMISFKKHHMSKRSWVEKGVIFALLTALFMGMSNFLIGFTSRVMNPLLVLWFTHALFSVISFSYILANNQFKKMWRDISNHKALMLSVSFLDNFGWIAFAVSMTLIPIAIATSLSESYIAIAALLGLMINKEKLYGYQKLGLVIALLSAITLGFVV